MFRKLTGRRIAVGVGVVASLALAVGAYAYFTSTGSDTGSAQVGSSTTFTVDVAPAIGGPLYPGAGSQNLPYTVTNPSSGQQNLSGTTSSVASSGGFITEGGTPVAGCMSSWFTAANSPPALPQNLAGGQTSTPGSVTVTMQDSGTSQDACQGHLPDITVNAS
jgi:hypothetical protein